MFSPNNNNKKYKCYHRAHLQQRISKNLIFPQLQTGVIGLKILEFGFLFPDQLQAVFYTLNKILKKKASLQFFAFPNSSLTTKKVGARMGKGKGKVLSSWVLKALSGSILFEIHTNYLQLAYKAIKIARKKLPLASKIIFNIYKLKVN